MMEQNQNQHAYLQHVNILMKEQDQISLEARTSEIDNVIGYIEFLDQVRQTKVTSLEQSWFSVRKTLFGSFDRF